MDEVDRQSERIERAALLSLHEHCPVATREALGLFCEQVADALVCGAARDPSILLNRALGMGTQDRPVAPSTVRSIAEVYQRHEVNRYFLHAYPSTVDGGVETLRSAGLNRARGWMKFRRRDAPPLERETELDIRKIGEEGSADFGRIVALAFGMTEAAGPLLGGLVHDPRWHLFVSYAGDRAAGAGALFVEDGAAWFEWGATDPDFRRRGSQGAIMTARIRTALDLGCNVMFTETGEAVGDDPQHSYGNIVRYGFEESVLRENWAPAAD